MSWRKGLLFLLVSIGFAACSMQVVSADGIIVPEPPICDPGPCPEPFPISQLAIEYHHVTVSIEDQVAVTHVDQVFRNDQVWPVEGTYIFPLPADASVSSFTLWIGNEPVEAEILDAEEARAIYEEIVRELRDPALLEYIDRGAVQASVFPIEPGEERRIELEYSQVLLADQGLIHYSYPLNTEKFSTIPLEDVAVSIQVESDAPVRAIYSPSHAAAIDRQDDHAFKVGYEAYNTTPDTDFELYYSVSMEDVGVNLLTYQDPYAPDEAGYFLLMAAPGIDVDETDRLPKDVFFVLDQSGSMEGEKLHQAQQAASYVLDHLQYGDRFNLLSFSTGVRSFSSSPADIDSVNDAQHWLQSLAAMGATDINLALLEVVNQVDPDRPTLILFLTDGLPTEGVIQTEEILRNLTAETPDNVRLFAFGVGYDVDTFLLDSLASNLHGATTYVTPDQQINEIVSGFFTKVNTPVLTDLSFDAGEIQLYDLHPSPLPDLFAGGQLLLTGRYNGSGNVDLSLTGEVQQEQVTYEYPEVQFRRTGGADFLPRLWATRKIGSLLNQIRLSGPEKELIDQVISISVQYGIITPYTSFLVTEPEILDADTQSTLSEELYADELAASPAVSGEGAVERAAAENEIADADIPLEVGHEAGELVEHAGTRTFRLLDNIWVDTRINPENMETTRVPFLSESYFELSASSPDIAAALALGEKVILKVGDTIYEIVAEDSEGDPLSSLIHSDENTNIIDGSQSEENTTLDADMPQGVGFSFCSGTALLGLAFIPLNKRIAP